MGRRHGDLSADERHRHRHDAVVRARRVLLQRSLGADDDRRAVRLARDLWQGPQSAFDLLAQAVAEGAAALLITAALVPGIGSARVTSALAVILIGAMVLHLSFLVFENLLAPSPTRHHELAVSAIRRGPFARLFWRGALVISILSIAVGAVATTVPFALALAAVLALAGSFAWEYVWVEAGQRVALA